MNKMLVLLQDQSKFLQLGSVDTHDRTSSFENEISKRLFELHKRGELSREYYKRIKLVDSLCLRMYGLLKIHKQNVPLRPIGLWSALPSIS